MSEIDNGPSTKSTPSEPLVKRKSFFESHTMRQRIQATNRKPSKKESVRTIFMAARENSVSYLQAILNPDRKIKFKHDCLRRTKKEQTHVLQGVLIKCHH